MSLFKRILKIVPVCAAVTLTAATSYVQPLTVGAAESYISQCEEMLKIINQKRKAAGVGELKLYIPACTAARTRAEELVKKYDHFRPDGKGFDSILSDCRISTNKAAENIAYASFEWSVQGVMDAWMNSERHRNNMLSPSYKYFGVGIVNGQYWEQLFIGDITQNLKLGDVNGDGAIDAIDASNVLEYYAYTSVSNAFTQTDKFKDVSDVDGNKDVNAIDASVILKYYADKAVGKPASFPRK